MSDHQVTASKCPACERSLDGALNAQGEGAPEPGDLTVCAYCATYLAFGPSLELRPLSTVEYEALTNADRYALMRARSVVLRAHGAVIA